MKRTDPPINIDPGIPAAVNLAILHFFAVQSGFPNSLIQSDPVILRRTQKCQIQLTGSAVDLRGILRCKLFYVYLSRAQIQEKLFCKRVSIFTVPAPAEISTLSNS